MKLHLTHHKGALITLVALVVACLIGLLVSANSGGSSHPKAPSLQAETDWANAVEPVLAANENNPSAMVQLLESSPPPPYDAADWHYILVDYQAVVTDSENGNVAQSQEDATQAINAVQTWQDHTCNQYPTLCSN